MGEKSIRSGYSRGTRNRDFYYSTRGIAHRGLIAILIASLIMSWFHVPAVQAGAGIRSALLYGSTEHEQNINAGIARLTNNGHAVLVQHQVGGDYAAEFYAVMEGKVLVYDSSNQLINTLTLYEADADNNVISASISPLKNGGFVVAWINANNNWDSSQVRAYYQIYDNTGQPVGPTVKVSEQEGKMDSKAIEVLGQKNGGFAIAFALNNNADMLVTYAYAGGAYIRQNETVIGDVNQPVALPTYPWNAPVYPAVARLQLAELADGSLILEEWTYVYDGSSSSPMGDFIYKFNADGTPANFASGYPMLRVNWMLGGDIAKGYRLIALSDGGFATINSVEYDPRHADPKWAVAIYNSDGTSRITNELTQQVMVNGVYGPRTFYGKEITDNVMNYNKLDPLYHATMLVNVAEINGALSVLLPNSSGTLTRWMLSTTDGTVLSSADLGLSLQDSNAVMVNPQQVQLANGEWAITYEEHWYDADGDKYITSSVRSANIDYKDSITFNYESGVSGYGTKTVKETILGETLVAVSDKYPLGSSVPLSTEALTDSDSLSVDWGSNLDESSVTFSLEGNKRFDLTSIQLGSYNNDTDYILSTSKGSIATPASGWSALPSGNGGSQLTIDVAAHADAAYFQGITSFTITAPSGELKALVLDEITLDNIEQVSGGNVFTVTHTHDDNTPGSLRWAIQQAGNVADGQVVFDPSLAGETITLQSDLTEWDSLGHKSVTIGSNSTNFTLTGLTDASGQPAITIDGNGHRGIWATGSGTFSLSDVKLTGFGLNDPTGAFQSFGSTLGTGGSYSKVSIHNVIFEGNSNSTTSSAAIAGLGAPVAPYEINLNRVVFASNHLTSTSTSDAALQGVILFNSYAVSTISNSLFYGNTAQSDTALGSYGSVLANTVDVKLNFVNNTVYNNSISNTSGGAFGPGAFIIQTSDVAMNAYNNLFIGNTANGTLTNSLSTAIYNYGDAATIVAANNLYDGNPFVNALAGDFRLAASAVQAIDQGDDSKAVGTIDLTGGTRIRDSHIDLGAYEYIASPTVTAAQTPSDQSTGVDVSTNLTMKFSESVTASIGKNIMIKQAWDDEVAETIPATASNVQISGDTVTINPNETLLYGSDYYVEVDAGAFQGTVSGYDYAGIAGKTTWRFQTQIQSTVTAANAAALQAYLSNAHVSVINLVGGTSYTVNGVNIDRELTVDGKGAEVNIAQGIPVTVISRDATVGSPTSYTGNGAINIAPTGDLKLTQVALINGNSKMMVAINVQDGGKLEFDQSKLQNFFGENTDIPGTRGNTFGIHSDPGNGSVVVITDSEIDESNAFRNVIDIRGGQATITGNTLKGTQYPERLKVSDRYEYGIFLYGGTTLIENNTIDGFDSYLNNNYSSSAIGVVGYYDTTVTIRNNTLTNNFVGVDVTNHYPGINDQAVVTVNTHAMNAPDTAGQAGYSVQTANTFAGNTKNIYTEMAFAAKPYTYMEPQMSSASHTNTTATLAFPAPGNGATAVKLQQSTDGGSNWQDASTAALDLNSTSAVATGLAADTDYMFRLVVEGGYYWGYSNFVPVTTSNAQVEAPTANVASGTTVSKDSNVTLSSATSGATIYYTVDGTTPTVASASGTSVTLTGAPGATVTVKAIAVKSGMVTSEVTTYTYTLESQVEAPTASVASGTTVSKDSSVTLSSATSGATIYYTVDGTTPTVASASGTSVTLTGAPGATVTVKAIAVKSGMVTSEVTTYTYTLESQVEAPTASVASGTTVAKDSSVTLSSATSGATIYYTVDGTTPTVASASGTSVTLTGAPGATVTVKAIAVKSGMVTSEVSTYTYTLESQVEAPTASVASGTTVSKDSSVTLSSATSGATIYYTVDGTTPTVASASGTSVTLTGAPGVTVTVKAIAVKSGMVTSEVSTYTYTLESQVEAPTANVASGTTVAKDSSVTLSSATSGATIYYTVDGTTPTSASSSGTSVTITGAPGATVTVKAIAVKNGMVTSEVTTYTYTLELQVEAPTANVASGTTVSKDSSVTLSSATSGATIYYTVDGTTPTVASASGTSVTLTGAPGATVTVKAIAVKSGMVTSEVTTYTYTLESQVEAPTASVASGTTVSKDSSVTLSSATSGATIYYTVDGTTPTVASASGTSVTLTGAPGVTVTVKAIAVKSGMVTSEVSTYTYTLESQVEAPTASVASGTTVAKDSSVTLSSATSGATIYYTVDGTTPTVASASGTSVTLTGAPGATVTVKAIAMKSGMVTSEVSTYTYTLESQVEAPTANVASGTTIAKDSSVTLSSATSGATIYYTVDGTTPTVASASGSSVTLTGAPGATVTVKAIAVKSGMVTSEVTTYTYTLESQVEAPTASVASGTTVSKDSSVTLSSATSGATIYYTVDGTTPTIASASGTSVTLTGAPGANVTVKAIAVKSGMVTSEVSTYTYTLESQVEAPTANVASGTTVSKDSSVTLSSATSGATIYYTVDGTMPTVASASGTSVTLTGTPGATVTVKAIAMKSGMVTSEVTTYTYTLESQVEAPTASVASGTTVAKDSNVTLSSATSGATIYYTVDGTTPTVASASGTSVTLTGAPGVTVTVKAIAVKSGMVTSEVTTYTYTLEHIYAIGALENQTFNVLTQGYASTSKETKTMTLKNTGTGTLTSLTVRLDGEQAERFVVTQPQAASLIAGATTSFTITAKDGLSAGTYTAVVTVSAGQLADMKFNVTQRIAAAPVYPSTPSTSSTPTTPDTTPGQGGEGTTTGVEVLVNGKVENAGTATTGTRGDQSVIKISIDQQKLDSKLAVEGNGAIVTIPVRLHSDVVVGELNGQMIKNMENKQAVLELRTDTASYKLPALQMNIDDISSKLGQPAKLEDIKIQVEIAASQETTRQTAARAAEQGSFTLMALPMDFTVTAEYGGNKVEVSKFNVYVERSIALPEGIDPHKITTGVVIEPDGTVRHVPTQVQRRDSIYYAVINSLTNSTYSVVWHPLEFADAEQHWAGKAINDMGSRMVIEGTGGGMFSPDRNITRAEFAAIIVRGLGLKLEKGNTPFSDVKSSAWYASAVATASAYGLVNGFQDGTFRPNENITREQAMVIMAKAMALTGLKAQLKEQSAEAVLRQYTDQGALASWASDSAADCLQSGILTGRSAELLAPKANITRAEVATLIQRLLQQSELI